MKKRLVSLMVLCALGGCAVRQQAVDRLGDAIAASGSVYASEDDPELVREAAPFSLKLIESLLQESPRHPGLLLAAARGFTQYAYAFVQQEADEAEDRDLERAAQLQARARGLYRRARDYGRRGLAEAPEDVGLVYWTAVSTAAYIALSKHDPEALADLPQVQDLIQRALMLDDAFDAGALHTFMVSFLMAQPAANGHAAKSARRHFARAMELSGGSSAALVALAEAVCVPQQRRAEFERLLQQALELDVDRAPGLRLSNLVAQRRARWLLSRTDRLFLK